MYSPTPKVHTGSINWTEGEEDEGKGRKREGGRERGGREEEKRKEEEEEKEEDKEGMKGNGNTGILVKYDQGNCIHVELSKYK